MAKKDDTQISFEPLKSTLLGKGVMEVDKNVTKWAQGERVQPKR